MKLLAIDSSGQVASIALLEDNTITAEFTILYKNSHSQTLLPMLENVRERLGLDLHSLDAIAVAAGPGSFTGLRIGSATAKGIGLALNIPLISVSTVDAMAYNFYGMEENTLICPIMDARRNQVYTGIYHFTTQMTETERTSEALHMTETAPGSESSQMKDAGKTSEALEQMQEFETLLPASAISIEELIETCNGLAMGNRVLFTGDGIPVYEKILRDKMQKPFLFAAPGMNRQKAIGVALLGAKYYQEGRLETAADHKPIYLRVSQAERERMEKQNMTM